MKEYGRALARIDLDAVLYNLNSIKEKISRRVKIIAVVKADGYGHGAAQVAKAVEPDERVFGFAVATAQEAGELRRAGIKKPLLILGYAFEEDYESLIRQDARMTVYSYEMARQMSEAAGRAGKPARIHVKIDTGMGRIGFPATGEAADEIARLFALPGIITEGLFTHFARADEADKSHASEQLALFQKMDAMLGERKVTFSYRHCANSAAIAELPEACFDLVRAGIVLYGLWPSDEVGRDSISIRPAMELKSRIVHIKSLEAGACVSYGGTYRLTERRTVATIPVGYADGYPRSLSNKGYVLIRGTRAPILGRICMDQFMADVTDIKGARLLDPVTLLGRDGDGFIGMEELGDLSGRFNYEFACDIARRVPRAYFSGGQEIF